MLFRSAQVLLDEITAGRHAVGARLPTEAELEQRFGVSRNTVRLAIRRLRELGVVTARAGIGTTVTASTVTRAAVMSMNSISDLLQFTKNTRLQLLERRDVVADAALAQVLRCAPGQAWIELKLLRTAPRVSEPIGLLHVWVRPEFTAAAAEAHKVSGTVFSLLEKHYGVELHELQQDIAPAGMPGDAAAALGVKPGSPALRILRHYYDREGQIPQVSLGYYAEGRFSYSTRLHLSAAVEG